MPEPPQPPDPGSPAPDPPGDPSPKGRSGRRPPSEAARLLLDALRAELNLPPEADAEAAPPAADAAPRDPPIEPGTPGS